MLEVLFFVITILFTFFSCSQDGRGSKNRVLGSLLLTSNLDKKTRHSSGFPNSKVSQNVKKAYKQMKSKQLEEEKCNRELNEIQVEIHKISLNVNKNEASSKKSRTYKHAKNENAELLDKTQSYKEPDVKSAGKLSLENKSLGVPKTKRQRRKDKKAFNTSQKVESGRQEKTCKDDIISIIKIENLFKKFNDSSKDPIEEVVKEGPKVLSKSQYQFREKPPPEPIDKESSLIILPPSVNVQKCPDKNEPNKVIQPEMIKRTKKEQKMVEGTWYNKILDENTLDDVPSDWDENRRPKRKKQVKSNFDKEYDNIII
uniref:Uncharacterized protein n=1 Tax=Strongyloides venezuelensis TaxID=75913 RepID=A0A0K0FEL3_STRVS